MRNTYYIEQINLNLGGKTTTFCFTQSAFFNVFKRCYFVSIWGNKGGVWTGKKRCQKSFKQFWGGGASNILGSHLTNFLNGPLIACAYSVSVICDEEKKKSPFKQAILKTGNHSDSCDLLANFKFNGNRMLLLHHCKLGVAWARESSTPICWIISVLTQNTSLKCLHIHGWGFHIAVTEPSCTLLEHLLLSSS